MPNRRVFFFVAHFEGCLFFWGLEVGTTQITRFMRVFPHHPSPPKDDITFFWGARQQCRVRGLFSSELHRFNATCAFWLWQAMTKESLVGGFLHPSEKSAQVKLDHFPRVRGENKKWLKPPPRSSLVCLERKTPKWLKYICYPQKRWRKTQQG